MKKQRVFSLLLVCLMAFGLLFALFACTISVPESSGNSGNNNPGNNNPGGSPSASLSGTYYYDSYLSITFSTNGTFIGSSGSYTNVTGYYTVTGSTIQLSESFYGRTWQILDANTIVDGTGDWWRKG